MLITDPDKFKSWLSATLNTCCRADPHAVGRYIFALVKKDKPQEELRKFLLDQLEIFLSKGTSGFVDLLFETLRTQSYIKDVSDIEANGLNKGKSPYELLLKFEKEKKDEKNAKGSIDIPPEHTDRRNKTKSKDAKGEGISDGNHEKDYNKHEKKEVIKKPVSSEESKRCPDYDERGFCLRGDLCPFDHGKDPILVEDVSEVLHFTDKGDHFFEAPPLPPTEPPVPPPPPPPPPLPSLPPPPINSTLLGTNVLQPYNPEFPGFWGHTPCVNMPPPPLPSTAPSLPHNNFYPKPSKHQRTRELIGIKTINADSSPQMESKLASHCDSSPPRSDLKRKGSFDFKRLGPPRKKAIYGFNTLELRNVPVHQNNIAMLNRHFSKFGHIASLEIGYDNDPQAALVKFVDPNDASVAYRSSDPIFNNRFIRVFFKKDSFHDSENTTTALPLKKKEIKIFGERSLENSIVCERTTEINKSNFEKEESPIKMHASVFSKKGNLSRTVFNNAPALKNFPSPAKNNSTTRKIEKKEDSNSVEKKLVLLKRKQEFLLSLIEHEKLIVENMTKCKNQVEMNYLKKTFQEITIKISNLKDEMKADSEALKNLFLLKTEQGVSKSEVVRKLLDAEMDRYRENASKGLKEAFSLPKNTTTKDETAELLSRVNELQQKAKAFIDSTSSTLGKNVSVSSQNTDHHPRKIMDTQSSAVQNADCLKDNLEPKSLNTENTAGDYEEEDEEEDRDARPWRH